MRRMQAGGIRGAAGACLALVLLVAGAARAQAQDTTQPTLPATPQPPAAGQAAPGSTAPEPAPAAAAPALPALQPTADVRTSETLAPPSPEGQGPLLTIEEAYRLALKHPSLRAGEEGVTQAGLVGDRVLSAWRPTVTATGSYTHYDSEITFGIPDFSTLQVDLTQNPPFSMETKVATLQKQDSFGGVLSAQVPLFVGPLIPQLKKSKDIEQSARLQYDYGQRGFLLMPVAGSYYGLVATTEAVEVARRTVETARQHQQAMARLFEVGQATRLAVLQAEIAVVQAEQKLAGAMTSWRSALRGLQILLQLEAPVQVNHPPLPAIPAGDEQALYQEALSHRLDYRAAKLAVEAAGKDVDTALWKYAPTLMGTGMYRVSDSENFAGDKTTWQVGLALSLPLYDGGTRSVDRSEAESRLRQATEQRLALENRIASEINERFKAVQGYETDLVTIRHTVALAKEGVAAARASFDAGMATNLDVLDANQKLFEAEIGQIQLQIQLDLARLQLAHSVGVFDPLAAAQTTGGEARP